MINGSFVFGMDGDDPTCSSARCDWAVEHGHRDRDVPHPDAVPGHGALPADGCAASGRITTTTGICYDTRHVVFTPARHDAGRSSKRGYWRAYRDFYRWGAIVRGAAAHATCSAGLRHVAYAGGLEEVRAAVGSGHPREARRHDAAGPRDDPQRVRFA